MNKFDDTSGDPGVRQNSPIYTLPAGERTGNSHSTSKLPPITDQQFKDMPQGASPDNGRRSKPPLYKKSMGGDIPGILTPNNMQIQATSFKGKGLLSQPRKHKPSIKAAQTIYDTASSKSRSSVMQERADKHHVRSPDIHSKNSRGKVGHEARMRGSLKQGKEGKIKGSPVKKQIQSKLLNLNDGLLFQDGNNAGSSYDKRSKGFTGKKTKKLTTSIDHGNPMNHLSNTSSIKFIQSQRQLKEQEDAKYNITAYSGNPSTKSSVRVEKSRDKSQPCKQRGMLDKAKRNQRKALKSYSKTQKLTKQGQESGEDQSIGLSEAELRAGSVENARKFNGGGISKNLPLSTQQSLAGNKLPFISKRSQMDPSITDNLNPQGSFEMRSVQGDTATTARISGILYERQKYYQQQKMMNDPLQGKTFAISSPHEHKHVSPQPLHLQSPILNELVDSTYPAFLEKAEQALNDSKNKTGTSKILNFSRGSSKEHTSGKQRSQSNKKKVFDSYTKAQMEMKNLKVGNNFSKNIQKQIKKQGMIAQQRRMMDMKEYNTEGLTCTQIQCLEDYPINAEYPSDMNYKMNLSGKGYQIPKGMKEIEIGQKLIKVFDQTDIHNATVKHMSNKSAIKSKNKIDNEHQKSSKVVGEEEYMVRNLEAEMVDEKKTRFQIEMERMKSNSKESPSRLLNHKVKQRTLKERSLGAKTKNPSQIRKIDQLRLGMEPTLINKINAKNNNKQRMLKPLKLSKQYDISPPSIKSKYTKIDQNMELQGLHLQGQTIEREEGSQLGSPKGKPVPERKFPQINQKHNKSQTLSNKDSVKLIQHSLNYLKQKTYNHEEDVDVLIVDVYRDDYEQYWKKQYKDYFTNLEQQIDDIADVLMDDPTEAEEVTPSKLKGNKQLFVQGTKSRKLKKKFSSQVQYISGSSKKTKQRLREVTGLPGMFDKGQGIKSYRQSIETESQTRGSTEFIQFLIDTTPKKQMGSSSQMNISKQTSESKRTNMLSNQGKDDGDLSGISVNHEAENYLASKSAMPFLVRLNQNNSQHLNFLASLRLLNLDQTWTLDADAVREHLDAYAGPSFRGTKTAKIGELVKQDLQTYSAKFQRLANKVIFLCVSDATKPRHKLVKKQSKSNVAQKLLSKRLATNKPVQSQTVKLSKKVTTISSGNEKSSKKTESKMTNYSTEIGLQESSELTTSFESGLNGGEQEQAQTPGKMSGGQTFSSSLIQSPMMTGDLKIRSCSPTKNKCKIYIGHQNYTHLEQSPINIAFALYNEFLSLTFKSRGLGDGKRQNGAVQLDLVRIGALGKAMNLNLPKNFLNDNMIKNREISQVIKEKLNNYLHQVINEANGIILDTTQKPNFQQYKSLVDKGNNSVIIKRLFKQRYWWHAVEKSDSDEANFIWTQWRKNYVLTKMPILREDNENSFQKKKKQSNADTLAKMYKESEMVNPNKIQTYNRVEDNFHISNKKALFINMKLYYESIGEEVFKTLPVTFHIKDGLSDPQFGKFEKYFKKDEELMQEYNRVMKQSKGKMSGLQENIETFKALGMVQDDNVIGKLPFPKKRKNIWIVKPGENTNRGNGIIVTKDFNEIKQILIEQSGTKKTSILQRYIDNPLLIHKRKFDIRTFAMYTGVNGKAKAYFYTDGYLRTSCKEFSLTNMHNRMIHLTNDAVQKKDEDYGKYEPSNKLSYEDFQKYIETYYPNANINVWRDLVPQMQKMVADSIRAVYNKMDPNKRANTFEIYGYDFMLDDQFQMYLIEVNTNPCLDQPCPLLSRMIPHLVENSLRIAVDPLFPPPEGYSIKKQVHNDLTPENKYVLIFDETTDGHELKEIMKEANKVIVETDEEESEGYDEEDEDPKFESICKDEDMEPDEEMKEEAPEGEGSEEKETPQIEIIQPVPEDNGEIDLEHDGSPMVEKEQLTGGEVDMTQPEEVSSVNEVNQNDE